MRCRECGYQSVRWLGRCPGCGAWHSFEEEGRGGSTACAAEPPRPITEVVVTGKPRFTSGIAEMDRVLGGGIVPGAVVLLGGDPGIGKSTFLLQVAFLVAGTGEHVLYASGEESALQVRLRAERLGALHPGLYLVAETDIERIENHVAELRPRLVVVDSIQTVFHAGLAAVPGSLGQVRECTLRLTRLAKSTGIPVLLVGHVTKEGVLAGPRTLEHMVDTVLYLEGDRHHTYRVLRGVKNRFGSTNEIGVFEMNSGGLSEVENPSRLFLSSGEAQVPGSVVVSCVEGTRPLLVEIQALVSATSFGTPRRLTTGVDYNRVILMTAVLEKQVGMVLSNQDVYVNAVGGVRVTEPAADLGIALALASSFQNRPLPSRTVAIGEVGLTGELRPVPAIEKRLKEAGKLGFVNAVLPDAGRNGAWDPDLRLFTARSLKEVLEVFFTR
jgi:DNA repair protein RadA/Sms